MKKKTEKEMNKEKLYSDLHFGGDPQTHEEIKALAKATAEMITDPTNTTIAVMLEKNSKIIKFTR